MTNDSIVELGEVINKGGYKTVGLTRNKLVLYRVLSKQDSCLVRMMDLMQPHSWF
jgi:hypothetical protein